MQDVVSTEFDADIARLEKGIRQLKIQYDMFFAGSIPKEPIELRYELDKIVRRLTQVPIRKLAPRFHFNALVSRLNSQSELWAKKVRTMEEGDRPAPAIAERAGGGENIVSRCTVQDPAKERDVLRLLHGKLLEARKKAGDGAGKLSFENFVRTVSAQAERLREKAGCDKVELRVIIADRKVLVKARPGR